jgi:uncharacterized protein involved in outer membrane biogenesis
VRGEGDETVVWLKRLAWLVGGILLLWLITWLAVPPLLKWQAQTRLSDALGREVTLGEVKFKPWSLDLTVHDVVVSRALRPRPDAAGAVTAAASTISPAASAAKAAPQASAASAAEPLLRVARVHVDLSMASLLRRAPVISALEIDAPQLHVARTAPGHYDIDDLIERYTPRADAPVSKPASEPGNFALYNLQVRDAQVHFDDRPVGRVQRIEALQLALPFLSNLPADVDVQVAPHLAFKLNGVAFDSGAQATPFAETRSGVLKLAVGKLDLAPYLGYLPDSLPVRLARGAVSADLTLRFALPENGAPSVVLTGTMGTFDVAVTDTRGAPLLEWHESKLGLNDVRPLARKVSLGTLRIDGAQLHASRNAAGQINLLGLGTAPAAASASASASKSSPTVSDPTTAWQIGLESLELADARVLWNDVQPAAALQLDGVSLTAKAVHWPIAQPIALALGATLRSQAAGSKALGALAIEGPVTDHDAKLDVKLEGVALDAFAPYLAQAVAARVDGTISAEARLDWSGATAAPHLTVALEQATLDALKIDPPAARSGAARRGSDKHGEVRLKQLALADVHVDVPGRSVTLGRVTLTQPSLALSQPSIMVEHDRAGRLTLQRWLRDADRAVADRAAPAPVASDKAAASAEAPWHVVLKQFNLEAGRVTLTDAAVHAQAGQGPLRITVSGLDASLQNFEWQGDRATPPATVKLSARVSAPAAPQEPAQAPGSLAWTGKLGLQPLLVRGQLRVKQFPVQLFEPYFRAQLPVTLVRAEAGYSGAVTLRQRAAGLEVNADGDVLIGDLKIDIKAEDAPAAGTSATGAPAGNELLSWQSLALKGMKVTLEPSARPRVEIGEAALNDFYSRLVVTEDGRFNLQEVAAGGSPAEAAKATATAAARADAEPTDSLEPGRPPGTGGASTSGPNVAVAARSAETDAPLPLDISVGATTLTSGRIDFSDHFVRPNYSAALTELNGRLGAFSSTSREMATIELHGRAEGTAVLEISGQINPIARPLALDIRAKATDLELAPLSPYAGKYAGYAIERGKLSMDVAYKIDADGTLNASNQVILNQLTFGDKIDSPSATKLPVLLAVALLKDRHGVIDINLPVSGSLNDPQFSIGGIVVRIIVNLLTKALTAPFALLAGGGKDDLSQVEFKPGTAIIAPSSVSAIDKVAKALTERPALKMTVTGAADAAVEHDAYRRARLEALLRTEQQRERMRAGAAPAPAASAAGTPAVPALSPTEHAQLIKALYKRTDLPNKPRNALGFAKDIPPAEMEALLLQSLPVSPEAIRELALQRGIAVRDALIAKGLKSERLFLAAPKLHVAGKREGKGEGGAAWTPRVQLSLSVK